METVQANIKKYSDRVTYMDAVTAIANADMLIVGGTSLAVYPAASFIEYFNGKYIVIINKSETPFDSRADLVITDSIGRVFSEVMQNE